MGLDLKIFAGFRDQPRSVSLMHLLKPFADIDFIEEMNCQGNFDHWPKFHSLNWFEIETDLRYFEEGYTRGPFREIESIIFNLLKITDFVIVTNDQRFPAQDAYRWHTRCLMWCAPEELDKPERLNRGIQPR